MLSHKAIALPPRTQGCCCHYSSSRSKLRSLRAVSKALTADCVEPSAGRHYLVEGAFKAKLELQGNGLAKIWHTSFPGIRWGLCNKAVVMVNLCAATLFGFTERSQFCIKDIHIQKRLTQSIPALWVSSLWKPQAKLGERNISQKAFFSL